MKRKQAEFDGERANLYELAIAKFPDSRKNDIEAMLKTLEPKQGERIIGLGEGNGYFSKAISEAIGVKGYYLVTDPSKDQLENLVRRINLPQMHVQVAGAEEIEVPESSFDKVWCFGGFHHVHNQTEAMKRIYNALINGGKAIICEVFQGSNLARHFDSFVARYCVTGHEVKFLSEEFARTLCYLAGFDETKIRTEELPQKWIFDSEKDLGEFIYNLHAITLLTGTEEEKIQQTLESCKKILGVNYNNRKYELNWPMKALIIEK